MSFLSFTISPEGIARLGDAILCLAKFGENVSIEAQADGLRLTTLNSSKSAYASFQFNAQEFFAKYRFGSSASQELPDSLSQEAKFTCQIWNKALSSVFRGRVADTSQKETAVERCEVSLQEQPNKASCRFIIKMICRHGVVKTYKLTYESIEVVHAIFDKNRAQNTWSIQSKLLREFIEYFGPRTEQLDIFAENRRATFTSYTEKITDGKEVLKTPLHTSISLDTADFATFEVPAQLHIGISVKDFKSIVIHAETLHALVTARFSKPGRPLQLSYTHGGVLCEFTLMTLNDSSDTASFTTGSATPRNLSARPESRALSSATTTLPRQTASTPNAAHDHPILAAQNEMPPPPIVPTKTQTAKPMAPPFSLPTTTTAAANPPSLPSSQRPPTNTNKTPTSSLAPPPPQSTLDPESLFIPLDDDGRWDEPAYGDDDEDMLGWDASGDQEALAMSFGTGSGTRRLQDMEPTSSFVSGVRGAGGMGQNGERRVEATQRVSQIRGLFD